jgi:hypothetical protein
VEVEVESLFSLFSSKAVPQKWQLSTFWSEVRGKKLEGRNLFSLFFPLSSFHFQKKCFTLTQQSLHIYIFVIPFYEIEGGT